MSAPVRAVTVRHIQLLRALFAAIAAVMITFSPNHSGEVGLSVFGGFAVATGIVFLLSAWQVAPAGKRGSDVLLGFLSIFFGMFAGILLTSATVMFYIVVIAWAALTGITELVTGLRGRTSGSASARDQITVGAVGILLAILLPLIPANYMLDYAVEGDAFQLTGIILAVGLFGGYAAIVGVFLAIAGFSPMPATKAVDDEQGSGAADAAPVEAAADATADRGGVA